MIRLVLLAALGLLGPIASSLPAQELPAHLVGSRARWVAHVDVERLFESELFRRVLESENSHVDADELSEMARAYDLEPGVDLLGITVYGSDDEPERAVALVSGTTRLESALEHLVVPMKRTPVEVGGVTLHEWRERDDDGDADGERVYTYIARKADTDERLLIASAHPEEVRGALAVVRGEVPSLAALEPDMELTPSPGTIFFVAVSEQLLAQLDLDAPPQLTELVRAVRVELGEREDRTFLDLRLTTSEERQADQLAALVQGGRAALELLADSEPEARRVLPLLRQVQVTREGTRMRLHFEHPTAELLALAEELSDGEFRVEPRPAVEAERVLDDTRPPGSTGWR